MEKLVFGNTEQLLLTNKIWDFSKNVCGNEEKMKKYLATNKMNWLLADFTEMCNALKRRVQEYYGTANYNKRLKKEQAEILHYINYFLHKHILPKLIESGYFNNYKMKRRWGKSESIETRVWSEHFQ